MSQRLSQFGSLAARPAFLLTVGLIVGLVTGLRVSQADAQILDLPLSVLAEADGSFTFSYDFTYPAGGAKFGSAEHVGTINCGLHEWVDGFCVTHIAGGTQVRLRVSGQLTDPGADGQVKVLFFICEPDIQVSGQTTITHVVAVDEQSWSTLKARFQS